MTKKENSQKGFFSNAFRRFREVIFVLIGMVFLCFTVSFFLDTIEYAFAEKCAEGETETLYCYKTVRTNVLSARTEMRAKRRMYLDVELEFADGKTRFLTFQYEKDQKIPASGDSVLIETWRGKVLNLQAGGEVFYSTENLWINFSKMDETRRRWILAGSIVSAILLLLSVTGILFRKRIAELLS